MDKLIRGVSVTLTMNNAKYYEKKGIYQLITVTNSKYEIRM